MTGSTKNKEKTENALSNKEIFQSEVLNIKSRTGRSVMKTSISTIPSKIQEILEQNKDTFNAKDKVANMTVGRRRMNTAQ